MPGDDTAELELIVDIPEDEVQGLRRQFEQVGFAVVAKEQSGGLWALAAAKCG
jgi:hypothetical protein